MKHIILHGRERERRLLPLSLRRRLNSTGDERQTYHGWHCGSAKTKQFFTLVLNGHVCLVVLFLPTSMSSFQCNVSAVGAAGGKGRFNFSTQCAYVFCTPSRGFRVVRPRFTTRSDGAQPPPDGSRLIVGGWRKPTAWPGSDTDSRKPALTRQARRPFWLTRHLLQPTWDPTGM